MARRKRRFVSIYAYAKMRGVDRKAVYRRLEMKGGPIPLHDVPGKRHPQIDVDEADALWAATTDQRWAGMHKHRVPEAEQDAALEVEEDDPPASDADGGQTDVTGLLDGGSADPLPPGLDDLGPAAKARIASAVVKAQRDRLELEKLKGTLTDKNRALIQAFNFTRGIRDTLLSWPAKAAPIMAADLGVDQHKLTVLLENAIREQLNELSNRQLDLG